MKFLSKRPDSEIFLQNLVYKKGQDNSDLRKFLLQEQKNFCAYTEKYVQKLDSVEVEHFNSGIKFDDDYYNYYAVVRRANLYKKDEQYKGASFVTSLFFQKELKARIQFIKGDLVYEEIIPGDNEVVEFVDFIGLNHPDLYEDRKRHINRLKDLFIMGFDIIAHFHKYPQELSFITAIEAEFDIDLSEFYSESPTS
ncbi:MAG: hypothetical protein H7257_11420 [Taibaiella sp.]|nr:hypothetical protein [Taibaiella sp.]